MLDCMVNEFIVILNGASALILIIIAFCFAVLWLYYYTKKESKRHLNLFFLAMAVGFGWMGITITFLSVMLFGYNVAGMESIISYFSYSTIPVGAITVIYLTWDVFGSPTNKKHVLIAFAIYSATYYILLYTTFNQAVIISDTGIILDDWITPFSVFYYILWGQVLFAAIISSLGFNKFRKATTGDMSARSLGVIIASGIVGGGILLDTVILMEGQVLLLFIPRLMMIGGLSLIHWSFRLS